VQGNRLYRTRKFDEAITAYQAGALIEPAPIFDFNLGQCYRQLGRYADALWHYERFLRNGPPAELRGLVTELVQQVRAELVHKVMAHPPADGAAVPGAPNRARSVPSAPTTEGSSSIAAREGASPPWYSDAVGWTLLGGGILGAGSAGVLLAVAFDLRDDASSSTDEVRRAELHDAARVRRLGSAALGIGSAVLIATGAIKLAIHASERPRPRAGSWSLGVSPRGIAVLGRF
jgi:tetratricopeptide (TPR) repeat protein